MAAPRLSLYSSGATRLTDCLVSITVHVSVSLASETVEFGRDYGKCKGVYNLSISACYSCANGSVSGGVFHHFPAQTAVLWDSTTAENRGKRTVLVWSSLPTSVNFASLSGFKKFSVTSWCDTVFKVHMMFLLICIARTVPRNYLMVN